MRVAAGTKGFPLVPHCGTALALSPLDAPPAPTSLSCQPQLSSQSRPPRRLANSASDGNMKIAKGVLRWRTMILLANWKPGLSRPWLSLCPTLTHQTTSLNTPRATPASKTSHTRTLTRGRWVLSQVRRFEHPAHTGIPRKCATLPIKSPTRKG